MKRIFCIVICICMLVAMLGCNNDIKVDDEEVIQILSDKSNVAKEFALQNFNRYMTERGIDSYSVEQTFFGFYLSNTSEIIYIVCFVFVIDDEYEKYGYKIAVDETERCVVLDEGAYLADFWLGQVE